jgi:Transcriptional activator of glycolytic enzymes
MKEILREWGNEQKLALAQQLASIAVGLATPDKSSRLQAAEKPPAEAAAPSPTQERPREESHGDSEFERVFHWTIQNTKRPPSVTAIFQEYYGEGPYKDLPIAGGIKSLEDKYGTKWRSGDSGYQKAFSRFQLVVKCVDRLIGEGREKDVVLAEMDALFVRKECKTLQQFRNALEEADLLPKQRTRVRSTGPQGSAPQA